MRNLNLLKAFININIENIRGLLFKLNFAVTYKCNHKCRICNIWRIYSESPDKIKDELDFYEIERIFQKYKQLVWVNLTGGEPFLRLDLVDIVGAICENCEKLSILNIPTNGSLPDNVERATHELLEEYRVPLVFVSVSLDGDSVIHDSLRGVNGAWLRAIDTLSRLYNLSLSHPNLVVGFEYTMSPFNVGSFKHLLDKLGEYGLSRSVENGVITFAHIGNLYHNIHSCKRIFSSNEYASAALKEVEYLLERARGSLLNPFGVFKYLYLRLSRKFFSGSAKHFLPCTACSGSCFIDPYGKVYPCTIEREVLADLREVDYDLNKVIKSDNFISFRSRVERGLCTGCWSPCEAYPSIATHPLLSFYKAFIGK